ncbi:MAG: hypothetical protein CSA38_04065 [Flavobacteriales bacterium]|nr:MAG: hypothetical protein CSA38_04065 [Flavobacteriales bacterium]
MNKLILTLFLLLSQFAYSQNWKFEKPDYTKIEKNIQNKESNLFYDTLMKRFLKADSTMTLQEKRHLYYGYIFHKDYSPYSNSDYSDSLNTILEKQKSLEKVETNTIIDLTNKILSETPFDLNAFVYQLYALDKNKNKQAFKKRVTQMRIIIDALMSSGNGINEKQAFYVIYTSHEYNLLKVLGFKFGGTQSLIKHFDYLTLAENDSQLEGLYFDVSPCLNYLSKKFKD